MFIKQIAISAFKSFRDEVVITFDEHHSVIVGRNGHGKSNIFDAIRFVFGDQFGNLRADDKHKLIFDQGNQQYIQAQVVITLDNSDGRLPIEGSSVTVGRTVGLKKDEYFLSGKLVKKSDIGAILESAGFSRSNPYYIVAQGKVKSLAEMDDRQRLELIKQVAGTHVYEERRAETVATLEDTDRQRVKVEEVISSIESRLAELEGERAELLAWQKLDRTRRAVEYSLYSSELARAQQELDALEHNREAEGEAGGGLRAEAEAQEAAINKLSATLKALQKAAAAAESDARAAQDALPRLARKAVQAAARVRELKTSATSDAETQAALASELAAINARMAVVRAQLAPGGALGAAAALAEAKSASLKAQLSAATARTDAIYEKQGRGSRFKSKRDRDAHLAKLLAGARAEAAGKEKEAAGARTSEAAARARADKAAKALAAQKSQMAAAQAAEAAATSALEALGATRAASTGERSAAWASVEAAEVAARTARETVEASERTLHANTAPPVRFGLAAVSRLMADAERATVVAGASQPGGGTQASHASSAAALDPSLITGIVGPLYDLVMPKHPRYFVAADAVAGNQLFNVVVRDDEVAAAVVARLTKEKSGRVTLMPLNRLHPPPVAYPEDNDCRPLIQFLQFDDAHEAAVRQVFGRVLLCRSLEVAAKYAASHGLLCVTLEGDTVDRKGSVAGGYVDADGSRLSALASIFDARETLEAKSREGEALRKAALALDQRVAAMRGDEQRLTAERSSAREASRRLAVDAERSSRDLETASRDAEAKAKAGEAAAAAAASLREKESSLVSEMASELTSELSAAEEAELAEVTAAADALKSSAAAAAAAWEALRSEALVLQSELDIKLAPRAAELRGQLSVAAGGLGAADAADTADELAAATRELEAAQAAQAAASANLAAADELRYKESARVASTRAELEKLKNEAAITKDQLNRDSMQNEKVLETRRTALRKREECAAKLREIGTLPSDEQAAVAGKKKRELIAQLTKINEASKAYSHVNKKAAEQHATFANEREVLRSRKVELDKSDAAIRDLITTLDARKDEAILRTFKGVAAHFSAVFQELVPLGSATMSIKTEGLDGDEGDDEALDDEPENQPPKSKSKSRKSAEAQRKHVETFKGLAIQASFTDAEESKNITQMSGGQKTVIALAIIIAIQQEDPAPFYLFDEVDSALDPMYASRVAALINKQTHGDTPAQFISVTFKSEMLQAASKFIAVTMQNKVSIVREQSKAESIAFLRTIESTASGSRDQPGTNKKAKKIDDVEKEATE